MKQAFLFSKNGFLQFLEFNHYPYSWQNSS